METTLNKRSGFRLSDKTRRVIVDIICYLFIALFVYTAANKLMTFEYFVGVLGNSVLIGKYSRIVSWLVVCSEILFSILLLLPRVKKIGLIGSVLLMGAFTLYLVYMINSGSQLTCSCGGVISEMDWNEHILFNSCFILIGIFGIKLYNK